MTKLFKIQPRTEYGVEVFDVRWAESGLLHAEGLTFEGACKKARGTEAKYALEDKLTAEYEAECGRAPKAA